MHDKRNGHPDLDGPIDRALGSARLAGLPSLVEVAEALSGTRSRVGSSSTQPPHLTDIERGCFDCPTRAGKVITHNMISKGRNWRVADFGDTIGEGAHGPIADLYGENLTERNKWRITHLAAAGCCSPRDSDEALGGKFSQVMGLARKLRAEQYLQARE